MITIFNDSRDNKLVLNAIKLCETKEELDAVFGLYGISDYAKRTNLLNIVMGADETHYVGINNYPDAMQKYQLIAETFVQGSWRDALLIAKANKVIEALKTFEY